MADIKSIAVPERRNFFSRFQTGAAALAAIALSGRASGQTKSAPARVEPAWHDQDQWLDQLPAKHRMVIDSTSNDGFSDALLYANNFFTANRTGYGLESKEIGIVVIARHNSTAFAFNDAIWDKYGAHIAQPSQLNATPKTNPRMTGGFGIDALVKQGAHFAVCAMATGRLAGIIARATGATNDAITAELTANLVPNSHMVTAGIIIVNRAQERGYSLARA